MSINLGVGLLSVPGEWPWSYAMMALLHGLIYVSDPGRVWGFDGLRSNGLDAKADMRNTDLRIDR